MLRLSKTDISAHNVTKTYEVTISKLTLMRFIPKILRTNAKDALIQADGSTIQIRIYNNLMVFPKSIANHTLLK